MNRQLAQCPYCQECAISLNDSFRVVINLDTPDQAPCEHLIWANGGCSQWEPMIYGTSRIIGSTAIHWRHPELDTACESFSSYMEMLVRGETGWESPPAESYQIQGISEEAMALDLQGREYPAWEADGWAVFASRPREFLAAIVACREKQSGVWKDAVGQQARVSVPADADGENEGYFGNQRGRHALALEDAQSVDRWRDDGGQG